MSELDTIKQHLNTSRDAIRAASGTATQVEATLRDKSEQFAGLGLEGVVDVLNSARDGMETAAAALVKAHDANDTAVSELQGVTDKTKITDTFAALNAAVAKINEAANSIRDASAEADNASSLAAESEIEPAIEACVNATAAISEAQQATNTAYTQAEQYRQKIDAAAKAALTHGAGSTGAEASQPQTTEAAVSEDGKIPEFNPKRKNQHVEARIRGIGWPRNEHGRTSARGLLFDEFGTPLMGGKALPASSNGPGADTSDLREPWRSGDRYTTRYHVEGHVAAMMRRNGIRKAVLYLNLEPCGNRGTEPDPLKCEANLADLIPEGSTLWVHSILEDGRSRSKPYRGTGRALRD